MQEKGLRNGVFCATGAWIPGKYDTAPPRFPLEQKLTIPAGIF
jgi:hypothetical protein